MEQHHEEEPLHWVALEEEEEEEEEEIEEATLEGRKSSLQLQHHNKDNVNVIPSVVESSSPTIPKQEQVTEIIMGYISEQLEENAITATTTTTDSAALQIETRKDFDIQEQGAKTNPTDLIQDFDQQLSELDVEAVLEKQETHDLFCPNCNSCITKRVILRKRKRIIQNVDFKAKRDKFETLVGSSDLVDASAYETSQDDHEREPEVFRCLSCFRYFIPTENGFNLFRKFIRTGEQETSQNFSSIPALNLQDPSRLPVSDVEKPSNISAPSANWFFSLFTSNKEAKPKAFDASLEHSEDNPAELNRSSSPITSAEIGHAEGSSLTDTAISENGKQLPDVKVESQIEEDFTSNMVSEEKHTLTENLSEIKNDSVDINKTDSVASKSPPDDMMIEHGRDLPATAIASEAVAKAEEPAKDPTMKPYEVESDFSVTSMQASQILSKSFGSAELASDAITDIESSGGDAKYLPQQNLKLVEKVKNEIKEEIDPTAGKEKKGSDVIVLFDAEAVKSRTFQTEDSVSIEGAILPETSTTQTQVYIGEEAGGEVGEPYGWEILKSIVYGGLVESITSLGIVTSAASAGSSSLTIIALGLANLVGGLLIIGHNLMELKEEDSGGDPQQMNKQEDRYYKLLGDRVNFVLHAVLVVLSFIIFGFVPLVIYGIFTLENYSSEVKVAAAAATSLVCIILLAVAKVYTKGPPKSYVKTVLYYVILALGTAGVSYVVGGLIKDLLERISRKESGFVIAVPFLDTMKMKPAWTSY